MPVLHITDLFTPPGDPDDHFDLLTLLAVRDLPVAGVVIDQTVEHGVPGIVTVRKAAELCGKAPIPCVSGLLHPLQTETDPAEDQEGQEAVELILDQLGRCPDGSMIFTIVGSLRDLAAAYNRNPELFHAKTKRLMVNAGDSCGEVGPRDWNTNLDVQAWRRIMASGLPIDWYPCNPSKGRGRANAHTTWWGFPQNEFLQACPPAVRDFFDEEGIASDDPVWRHMWSTASLRDVAQLENVAMAAPASYELRPIHLTLAEDGTALWEFAQAGEAAKARIFTYRDLPAYEIEIRKYLEGLFASLCP